MRGAVMKAAEFVAELKSSDASGFLSFGSADGARVEVAGKIDFAGIDVEKGLSIRNVDFRDAVCLNNREFAGSVVFESCTFDQPVHLAKATLKDGLRFTDCTFGRVGGRLDRTAIILDDARIRGDLICDRITANGCISARRLRLAGSIEFTECTVDSESSPEQAALDLSDVKIKGSVNFETGRWPDGGAKLERRPRRSSFRDRRKIEPRSVLLRGADVIDMVKLSWAQFGGEVDLAFIKCRSLESEVGIFSRPATETKANAGQKSIKLDENVGGASITGPITLSGGNFGLIHLHGISISGEMMLIAGRSGQIIIEDGICPAEYDEQFIVPSTLGHFIMSSWRCSGFLHLHAAEVIGESNTSRIRGIVIRSSVINHSLSLWPGWRLQRSLERYLEDGCAERERPKFFVINQRGFFLPIECRGDYRNLLNRWRRQMVVRGNVSIDHCSIGDDLLLTGIDLIAKSQTDDGRIEIVNSKIDGNLVFRSPISFLADAQVDAPLLRLFAQRLALADPTELPDTQCLAVTEHIQDATEKDCLAWRENFVFVPACCHMLDTSGLKAVKIDLTGLCVRKPLERDTATGSSAHIAGKRDENLPNAVMSNIEVSGKIATFARLSMDTTKEIYEKIKAHLEDQTDAGRRPKETNWPRELLMLCFGVRTGNVSPWDAMSPNCEDRFKSSANIYGQLDLQDAKIGELLISDMSFRRHAPDAKASEWEIVLHYAQISKLYVARSQSAHARELGHNGFPVPVSLLDLSVKSWFLEDEETTEAFSKAPYIDRETTIAAPYLDLLENDPAFRMSSYLAVEKSLRDRGLADEAREIFIAGNYRDVRTESVKKQPVVNPQPAQPQAIVDAPGEKVPLPGFRPVTWRNWKLWRRADGRVRSSSIPAVRRMLETADRGVKLRSLMTCLAIICAAALVLIDPSPASAAYAAAVVLSLLALIYAAQSKGRWLEDLTLFLSLVWFVGALYAAVLSITQPSLFSFGYLATIVMSAIAGQTMFGPKQRRIEHLAIAAYEICILGGFAAIAAVVAEPSALSFSYLAAILCLFFTLRGNLFRLRRPRREYLGFLVCFVWCAAAVSACIYAVGPTAGAPSLQRAGIAAGILACLVAILFPLFAAMRCFLDQMYWSLVDYGTSAIRLAGVIFILMAVSFAFVSGNRHNFESTLLARSIASDSKRKVPDTPTTKDWVFGERVWMTLRCHVPLVGAVISDEWQPGDHKLVFTGLTDDCGRLSLPAWWWKSLTPPWPRARDWYGAMLWLNWILWPLFLPFLIHRLSRER